MREFRNKTATIALVFIGAAVANCPGVSFAEDSQQGPAGKVVAGMTKRGVSQAGRYGTDSAIAQTFTLPPLPGEQGAIDSAEEEDKFTGGQTADFGVNEKQNTNVSLPPLRGLSQILDSEVTKNYVKKAVTSKTAVLMQTMMMVENGAATGFGQAMNMGSNFYSNLLNTTDLQMKMMDVADETGQMKLAFVNGVAQKLKEGPQKDIWPGALYEQLADKGEFDTNKNKAIQTLNEAKPYDLSGLFTQESLKGSTGSADSRLLSDLLFIKGEARSGTEQSHKNDQIDELKQEFIKLVGDVEIKLEKNGGSELSRKVNLTFKAPEKGSSGSVRRGVAAVNWEEVKTVWENINKLLYDTCKWKQKPANENQPFTGESIATTKEIGGSSGGTGGGSGSPWELASSPDITMNVNVLEQIYKLVEDNPTKKGDNKNMQVNCEDLKLKATDIPDGTESSTGNFNDCKEKQGCFKNRVVLHLSYLIARSRTLHTYLTLYTISKKFVTDPRMGRLLDESFLRAFSGMDATQELHDNRARYFDFVANMGRYLQGEAGAGNMMKPGESFLAQGAKTGFGGTS